MYIGINECNIEFLEKAIPEGMYCEEYVLPTYDDPFLQQYLSPSC